MAEAPSTTPAKRPRVKLRSVLLGLGVASGGIVGGLGLSALVFLLFLTSAPGNRFLTTVAQVEAQNQMSGGGTITIGAIHTDLLHGIVVEDLEIQDPSGKVLVRLGRADVDLDPWALLRKRVHVTSAVVDSGTIDVTADQDGLTDLQKLFGAEPSEPSTEPWGGLPIDLDVENVRLRGVNFAYHTAGGGVVGAHGLNVSGAVLGEGTDVEVNDLKLAGTLYGPVEDLALLGTGRVVYHGSSVDLEGLRIATPGSALTVGGTIDGMDPGQTMALHLAGTAERLDLAIIQKVAPAQTKIHGVISGPITLEGPLDAVHVTGTLDGVDGTRLGADVDATLDLAAAELSWTGSAVIRDLVVEDIYTLSPGQSVEVKGTFDGSGKGSTWPNGIEVQGHFAGGPVHIEQPGKVIDLTTIESDLGLKGGVLAFDNTRADGPLGPLGAHGSLDLVKGDLVADVSNQGFGGLPLPALQALGIDDLGGDAVVTTTVTGNVFAADLPLQASGRVVIAPFTYGTDIRFERLEVGFQWAMRASRQDVTASVEGTTGVAYGLELATALAPGVQVQIAPDGSIAVQGTQTQLTELVYPSGFTAETAVADYTVLMPVGAPRTVTAAIQVGPHTLVTGFPGTRGTVGVDMVGNLVAFEVDLRDRDRELLATIGTFDLDASALELASLAVSPTPRQHWVADEPLKLVLTDGGIADAVIVLSSPIGGTIDLHGTIGTTGPLGAKLVLDRFKLETVAELFPEKASGVAGTLDMSMTLAGRADDPEIDGKIFGRGLFLPGVSQWLDVDAEVEATRERAVFDGSIGAAGSSLAHVHARIPVVLDLANPQLDADGMVDLDIDVVPGPIERVALLSEEDLGLPQGRVGGSFTATGPLGDPDFHLAGVIETEVPGWQERGRLEALADRHQQHISWDVDLRQGYENRGEFAGTGITRMGEAITWALGAGPEPDWTDPTIALDDVDARVTMLGTPLQSLITLSGFDVRASGQLFGGFTFTGSPLAPTIEGGFNIPDLQLADVVLEGAYLAIEPDERGFQLTSNLVFTEQGGLDIAGAIPLLVDLRKPKEEWVQGDLDLKIGGEGVPVGVFAAFTDQVSRGEGLIVIDGTVGGAPFDPQPRFSVYGDGLRIESDPNGIILDGASLEAAVDPTILRLRFDSETKPLENVVQRGFEDVTGSIVTAVTDPTALANLGRPGRIAVEGSTRLDGWVAGQTNVRITLESALVSYLRPQQVLKLSGDVVGSGPDPWTLEIRSPGGPVRVEQGLITYDATGNVQSPFRLAREVTVHRGRTDATTAEVVEVAASFWQGWDIDVPIDLRRQLQIRARVPFVTDYGNLGAFVSTANLDARLGSDDLRITQKRGDLGLTGTVLVADGRVGVFRAQFDLNSEGTIVFLGDPFDPLLALSGTMPVTSSEGSGSVTIAVGGSVTEPTVAFTSDQWPDQTDIFTILVTGRPPGDLGAGALGGVLLSVAGDATSGLNIPVTFDADGTIRYTLPTSSPKVHAEATYSPFAGDSETNRFTVGAEVQMTQRLLLKGAYGTHDSYIDLFWQYSY